MARRRATAQPEAEAEGPAKPAGIVARIKEAPKVVAVISSIVGLIVGILGLIYLFNPDAKPKGRAPTDATMQILDFQKHVTLARYLRSRQLKNSGYTPEQLARDGVVATVKVVGASGVGRADLFWTVRDVVSGSDITAPRYVHQLAAHFRIKTTGDSGGGAFWVPAPAKPGRYVVRFELDAPNGTILFSIPTEEFVVG
jgi:hypothetical protein